ncbi:MAG: endonuclease MutS2 [Planctomycetes bacterium]|nr:endonuclease MutS2 [Planctomycetota bacterium]
MNAHTLERLEFGKVLDRIAAGCMLPLGAAAVRALAPLTDAGRIRTRADRIGEAAAILDQGHDFGVERFEDPGPIFERAAIEDSALTAPDLQTVASVLRNARDFQRTFKRLRDTAPSLWKLSMDLAPEPDLLAAIERVIQVDGSVADDASEELRRIRRQVRDLQARIRKRLETLLQKADLKPFLTGDYVTLRNGRYVVPILATQAGEVPGIIHDRSDTGYTAFVEPQFLVGPGNELRSLTSDEEREIQRILRELTRAVREHLWGLRETLRVLVEFDVVRAAARYARAHHMTRPVFAEDGRLRIIAGRHPILEDAIAGSGGTVVPLDFELGGPPREAGGAPGAAVRTIAITGANAGGKTVSLKTIGLVCLMAQTGLMVPAKEGSTFPLLERVLVDIGDEQSIEANLSTFSGHIQHISEILAQAGARALVLLDEIGAGTDPVEGGALACAILKALHDCGALTVATTHLGQVKGFVHEQDGMENAAVQFDPKTLAPTYHLIIGLPGASHALSIARRHGLPEEVLRTAEGLVDSRAIEMEGLLARLTESLKKAEADAAKARRERAEAEEARKELAGRLEELKRERKESLRKAVEEARGLVDNTRREMERAIGEARRTGADAAAATQLRRKVEEKRASFKKKAVELAPKVRAGIPVDDLQVGRRVWVEAMNRPGIVVRVDERRGKVEVNAEGLAIEVDASALREPDAEAAPAPPPRGHTVVRRPVSVAPEVKLIGLRVEEAMRSLETYLNEACLAGLGSVRIIHGFGTGALRDAVQAMLKKHPLIASFHYGEKHEGGRGATIAVLK